MKRGSNVWFKWLIVVIIIMIIVFVIILFVTNKPKITNGELNITGHECASKGGTIINTLGGDGCKSQDAYLGNVIEMDCPCVCCKK